MSAEEPTPDRPPRRPRYSGTHPRRFTEKYKEHSADRYPAEAAKIIASGKTLAGTHRPIMVREILKVLAPKPGECAVDCTLGYGGHARELLASIQPNGRLLAVDADPVELPKTEARLRELGFPAETLVVRSMNFAGLPALLATEAPDGVDCLLADLGLSSMQIDDPGRGFTFKEDGPLDMRMNPLRGLSAAQLLSRLEVAELSQLLSDNADEPYAREIAKRILSAQQLSPLKTTQQLVAAIQGATARGGRPSQRDADTIRRVFQALRIAVNDEFGALDALLRAVPQCLKPGGRAAILTFHSGEDRRVKQAFKQGLQAGVYREISSEVTRATAGEQRENPRSASAKLRYAIKR